MKIKRKLSTNTTTTKPKRKVSGSTRGRVDPKRADKFGYKAPERLINESYLEDSIDDNIVSGIIAHLHPDIQAIIKSNDIKSYKLGSSEVIFILSSGMTITIDNPTGIKKVYTIKHKKQGYILNKVTM